MTKETECVLVTIYMSSEMEYFPIICEITAGHSNRACLHHHHIKSCTTVFLLSSTQT